MTILQQPDQISLSGNLKPFVITSSGAIQFILKELNTVLLESSYDPDSNGKVIIDLKEIIESNLTFKIQHDLIYEQNNIVKLFTADISGTVVQFNVIRCGVADLADTPSNWLNLNFLTWQPQSKSVTYYSPEWLTYYAVQNCSMKLKAFFNDGTSMLVSIGSLVIGKVYTANMQYAVIAGLLGQKYPTHYEVYVENTDGEQLSYIQRYYYSEPLSEEEQWFLFENSLGGLDTVRYYGSTDFDAEHEHKLSINSGLFSEIKVNTKRNYSKNSGHLSDYERRWLLDFFPAKKKYIYALGALRNIVVVESDVKYTSSELPSNYTFKYRFADNTPYLNLIRNEASVPENIVIPDINSPDFFLPPRLAEYPRITLSEGVILPAFDATSKTPMITTFGQIRDIIVGLLSANINELKSEAHSHENKQIIDKLSQLNVDVLSKITIDTNGNLRLDGNMYATGEISAYGLGSSSSGGTLYDRLDDFLAYDETKQGWVLSAKLGKELLDKVNAVDAKDSDKHYEQYFAVPALTYHVNHNLNKYPSVTAVNNDGVEVEGDVKHIDKNNLTVTYKAEFSCMIYCN